MSRAPARRQQLTLREHFFWTVMAAVTVSLALAVVLFVSAP